MIVRFHLPKDRDVGRIQLAITFMCRDVKHSKNWMCEYCGMCRKISIDACVAVIPQYRISGASARETHIVTNSWHHLEPPKLVVYVRLVPPVTLT